MKMPPLRLQHGLLFAAVALLFFAWGAWLVRGPQPAEPLPWLAEWQADVLVPLAEERLHLAELSALVAGELWLQPRPDGARLLYRGEWQADGEPWRLEAELALSEVERESLMAAAGDAEQPLAGALLAQLGPHEVVGLTLAPQGAVSVARLTASLGQPRLRLQLEVGEAWVYPRLGLTVHSEDERLRLLQVVPRRVLSVR
ncbi:hypothetical protein SBP02_19425 [Pseudomonas benzenivorans]|uniref:Outer membrane lipoprotein carrier protein LolA n=1 Tax=Pseudomonas benzenivorans TaxID=556533 RepID=A0ABZ0PVG9_9PSED|nr:hypothetical protein [Pseudomonas benzenivorans]WPC04900.1 hypothetical protein SBP02_19425 [Pseudomonas benzenivorans]